MRTILGIDPGSISTGYGVIRKEGDTLKCLSYGTIRAPKSLEFHRRLLYIYEELAKILVIYRPTEMAIEEVFTSKNIKSAIKLGEARGIALLAAAAMNIDVYEYPALIIKKAIVGYGQASKEQIRSMLKSMFGIEENLNLNASDALAIAVCHGNHQSKLLEFTL